MAWTEIKPIKSSTHLENSLEYITKDEKTLNKNLIDSHKCFSNPKQAELAFENTRLRAINKGNNIAWSIKQSFAPEDNVTPEIALEIGKECMKKCILIINML